MELGLGLSPTLIRKIGGIVALRVDIFSPNTSPVEAGTVTFTGKVLGPDTITDLEYQVDDGAFTSFTVAEDWSVDIDIELATTSVTIRATDDQLETATETFNFTAQDTTAPTISNPNLSSTPTANSITVGFNKATDNLDDTDLVYELYSGDEQELDGLLTIKSQNLEDTDTDVAELDITNLGEGQLVYYNVLVKDLSGNESIYNVDSDQTLEPDVTSFTASLEDSEIDPSDTTQVNTTIQLQDSTNDTINYASEDTDIATVNSSGLVTAVASGVVNITAEPDLNPSFIVTMELTVNEFVEIEASEPEPETYTTA